MTLSVGNMDNFAQGTSLQTSLAGETAVMLDTAWVNSQVLKAHGYDLPGTTATLEALVNRYHNHF